LRELNDLNFARFDAKLEQRLAEVRGELRNDLAALDTRLERRLGEQSRWLVGIWITVIVAALALWFRR
jgi:glutathione S-transferase